MMVLAAGCSGGGHGGKGAAGAGAAVSAPAAGGTGMGMGTGGAGGMMGGVGGAALLGSGGIGTGGTAAGGTGAGTAGVGPGGYPWIDASQIGTPVMISNAFTLAEGPLWDPCGHQLLFADVTASVIHTLDANDQIGVFMTDTSNANGLAFDVDGSLIMAQMGGSPGHIARRAKDGTVTALEPPGSLLHTPDDVIVRSDGTIYFTDGDFPPIGNVDLAALPVYGLKPGATALANGGAVRGPNGIELSPDEQTLYVDAYFESSVMKWSVAADGTITKGAALATGLSNPDSLCVDAAGNLYVGVTAGLQVLRPDGSKVVVIPVPSSSGTTNCTFGGDDGKTLYITAWTLLMKVENMPIPGLQWQNDTQRLQCN
jgi:gluconolactonase